MQLILFLVLSSKGFWHRDSKPSEVMDWSLNFGVQAVLHAQQCQQVPRSNDVPEGERGLQNILSGRGMHDTQDPCSP